MQIVVPIKQVPGGTQVPIDPNTGALLRKGVSGVINPEDTNALEEALLLKERLGARVTAISMGPPQAEESLREALAMGADEAILLCDRAFAGADTTATSNVLGSAINRLDSYDLIICGMQTSDGNTAQVGPQLAEYLGLPQITYVRKLEIEGNLLRAERSIEDGYELLETDLPALITVTSLINTPRKATIDAIMDACREKEVAVWAADDINIDKARAGLAGSLSQMAKTYIPEPKKRAGEIMEGSAAEAVQRLVQRLKEKNLL